MDALMYRDLEEALENAMAEDAPVFRGIKTTANGNIAIANVAVRAATASLAFPITPSTEGGVELEAAVSQGARNVWDIPVKFLQTESEHSAASACEGYAAAGGRVTNFTSGQGLILMKEVLYTLAGKRLPVVFNIAARALASQAINVHAGHDDVMGVFDTGWGMVFSKSWGGRQGAAYSTFGKALTSLERFGVAPCQALLSRNTPAPAGAPTRVDNLIHSGSSTRGGGDCSNVWVPGI